MRRAVLLTGHFPEQKRRGSMLWLSEELQARGWHVTHVTVGYSPLSRLSRDGRLTALDTPPRPGVRQLSPTLTATFAPTPLHPFGTRRRWLDALLHPVLATFPLWLRRRLRPLVRGAELVVVESGPPVLLAPLVRRHAPRAQLVYRVNDDVRCLGLPRWLARAELRYAPVFDRISTASPRIARRFAATGRVRIDPFGVPARMLDRPHPDPYGPRRAVREAVCAGTTLLDLPALVRTARARPGWRLHVLGRVKRPPVDLPGNLLLHGEVGFETAIAHVLHADIGLAPYRDRPGIEYQTAHSNRMLLYRHAGLPILAPDRLRDPSIPAIIGYGDLERALRVAETAPRRPERLPDWSEFCDRILSGLPGDGQNGTITPPFDVATVPDSARCRRV